MDWFQSNISKVDISDQNLVNICLKCMKNYKDGQKENQHESNENTNIIDETIETIDLTKQSLDFSFTTNFSMSPNLPNINNTLVVETPVTIEAPVTIEVPVTKTPDVFITLVCYNKFEKPHKKLDGTLAILFNPVNIKTFENIEEEILSCTLPKQWGKLNLVVFAIRFQVLLQQITMI